MRFDVGAVLCDVEGTTSSIAFVKDVLFPYAANHLEEFVEQHHREAQVGQQLKQVAEMAGLSVNDRSGQVQFLLSWIRDDVKATPLKALQGIMWENGYATGAYQAHVYPDAHERMTQWHDNEIPIFIYSSGSIKAQQLFFKYSEYGDMTPLLSGHFDTTTGPKVDRKSYERIAEQIDKAPAEILFLSDIEAELDAASKVGFLTACVARPEDAEQQVGITESKHPTIESFDELDIQPR